MEDQILRQSFELLENDSEFLKSRNLRWETIVENSVKWVLIKNFPIPQGYNVPEAEIALMLTDSYPTTQIDMVYVDPPLNLMNGALIEKLIIEMHDGRSFQRWSRHRTEVNPWRPELDDISTHIGLVEEWFHKETRKNA